MCWLDTPEGLPVWGTAGAASSAWWSESRCARVGGPRDRDWFGNLHTAKVADVQLGADGAGPSHQLISAAQCFSRSTTGCHDNCSIFLIIIGAAVGRCRRFDLGTGADRLQDRHCCLNRGGSTEFTARYLQRGASGSPRSCGRDHLDPIRECATPSRRSCALLRC
jgi:hypothetical protein